MLHVRDFQADALFVFGKDLVPEHFDRLLLKLDLFFESALMGDEVVEGVLHSVEEDWELFEDVQTGVEVEPLVATELEEHQVTHQDYFVHVVFEEKVVGRNNKVEIPLLLGDQVVLLEKRLGVIV